MPRWPGTRHCPATPISFTRRHGKAVLSSVRVYRRLFSAAPRRYNLHHCGSPSHYSFFSTITCGRFYAGSRHCHHQPCYRRHHRWWGRSKSSPVRTLKKSPGWRRSCGMCRHLKWRRAPLCSICKPSLRRKRNAWRKFAPPWRIPSRPMAADIALDNSKAFLQQAGEQFKSLKESSEKDLDEKKKLIDRSLSG